VPFRLTPNIQHFIGRTGVEGIMVGCITAIARSLSPPEFELDGTLHLFVRDELLTWQASYQRNASTNGSLAQTVYNNVEQFVRRTKTMGYMNENTNRNVSQPSCAIRVGREAKLMCSRSNRLLPFTPSSLSFRKPRLLFDSLR
jgi:transformation/transcription domain-associated protein